jgi:hypothetical protein
MLGTLLFVASVILGGFLLESYNHLQQFISESYATGTPYGIYLRLFGYIPSGVLFLLFSFSALKHIQKTGLVKISLIGFGVFYGIGTIIVSIFPCDIGCNKEMINPSVSQFIHNFVGALTYLIVPVCIVLIGISARKWVNGKIISIISILCGLTAIGFTFQLSADPMSDYIGLYQRIIEGSILLWLIFFAYYIKNQSNT